MVVLALDDVAVARGVRAVVEDHGLAVSPAQALALGAPVGDDAGDQLLLADAAAAGGGGGGGHRGEGGGGEGRRGPGREVVAVAVAVVAIAVVVVVVVVRRRRCEPEGGGARVALVHADLEHDLDVVGAGAVAGPRGQPPV